MKKSLFIISTIFLIILISGLFLFGKQISESFLLSSSDYKNSILVFSENECEKKGLSCGHDYYYYISSKGVYFHYDTIVYNEGWRFFYKDSSVGKDLINRLKGFTREKQVENMKNFSYESLGLQYVSKGGWK